MFCFRDGNLKRDRPKPTMMKEKQMTYSRKLKAGLMEGEENGDIARQENEVSVQEAEQSSQLREGDLGAVGAEDSNVTTYRGEEAGVELKKSEFDSGEHQNDSPKVMNN